MAEHIGSSRDAGTLSGMTEKEAQEFNGLFLTSFAVFTAVAIVAHILVWLWRPWLQTPEVSQASLDIAQPLLTLIS